MKEGGRGPVYRVLPVFSAVHMRTFLPLGASKAVMVPSPTACWPAYEMKEHQTTRMSID
jgi:hypothetical protein